MTISNEAVDVAVKVWSREIGEQSYTDTMRLALEAAAPIIRAEALREAAEAWWLRDDVQDRFSAWSWLKERAEDERSTSAPN